MLTRVVGHINNLYNTTFWALVQQGGMTHTAAEEFLKGTVSGDKNEILWSKFGINYNNEPEMYKKGSVVFREYALEDEASTRGSVKEDKAGDDLGEDTDERTGMSDPISKTQAEKIRKARRKARVVTKHVDIIRDEFWVRRPWLRSGKPGRLMDEHAES
jgi:tRNA(His) guanylyltransferase